MYDKTIKIHLINSNKKLTAMVLKYGSNSLQQRLELPMIPTI